MINDKKIEEAAKLNTDKYKWYPTLSDTGRCKVSRESFIDGAHWAIEEFLKDLWHPYTEIPKPKMGTCVAYYNNGTIHTHATTFLYEMLKNYGKNSSIKYWCYLTDLFPKQKGGER